ncbi:hypothetical protein DMA12_39555 [Amycolatopsis balhimycina DSM 5908]|uniref:ESX-1 secretion-associated protein n=1 Tax=Amycolatopsis balhimycina DSM 5908 TaxID=1081091 RepID=A0A428W0S1_AMYBA|nr:hypothetical protein [Amycolatopsis balhimycina]RSM36653.1 hypothetical protein DMA12_39555 [Amycolatopsis balhimycina DSM 5908]
MNGYEADPARLSAAASWLGSLARDARDRAALRYSARPELVGDALLAAALEDLQRASSAATKILLSDIEGLGERLETAARRYVDYQDEVRERLERLASEPGTAD